MGWADFCSVWLTLPPVPLLQISQSGLFVTILVKITGRLIWSQNVTVDVVKPGLCAGLTFRGCRNVAGTFRAWTFCQGTGWQQCGIDTSLWWTYGDNQSKSVSGETLLSKAYTIHDLNLPYLEEKKVNSPRRHCSIRFEYEYLTESELMLWTASGKKPEDQ
jgi:hypothetical protein